MVGLRGHLLALLATVALAGATAGVVHPYLRGRALPPGDGADALERARSSLLAYARETGLQPDVAEVAAFVDAAEPGLGSVFAERRFVFGALPSGESPHRDVFLMRARVAPNGAIAAAPILYDLTGSEDADERALALDGTRIAFGTRVQGAFTGVTLLDLAGERPDPAAPLQARLTRALTNALKTGDFRGIDVARFDLDTPTVDLRVAFEGGTLVVSRLLNEGWQRAHIDPERPAVLDAPWLRTVEITRAHQSLLSWGVDTARSIPWIGPEGIYALEQMWFRLADFGQTVANRLWRDMEDEDQLRALQASVVVETAAFEEPPPPVPVAAEGPAHPLDRTPPDIAPRVQPSLAHEGHWRPYHFQPRPAQAPPTFWRTTLRVDAARPDALTELVAMDPRQVEIRMVAGTEHPRSSTGAVGNGLVPAAERPRTLAAFNGGFQSIHGGYGMAVERRVYLPPKPQVATYALYEGGKPAFGTWPEQKVLPAGMRAMRQNLPPLVQDGKFNPLGMRTWGFTVRGTDPVFTWRSGLGVTQAGWLVYAACDRCSAESLADALIAADVVYAVHLDMNVSNIGFEWWRPGVGGGIETEHLMRNMWKAGEPRYVDAHNRDFFYVVRRPASNERFEAAAALFRTPPEAVTMAGAADRWPPRLMRGTLALEGRDVTVVWMAAPRLAAAVEGEGAPGGGCVLDVHQAVLGERLPASGLGDRPDPALPTLSVSAEGAIRLHPPGAVENPAFFQQFPLLVRDSRPLEGFAEAARTERWLLGTDAGGALVLLGGPIAPAALGRAAVALGVVTGVDPAPAGGAPALTCDGARLAGTEPAVSRAHRLRLTPAAVPPPGLAHVWGAAPPDHL